MVCIPPFLTTRNDVGLHSMYLLTAKLSEYVIPRRAMREWSVLLKSRCREKLVCLFWGFFVNFENCKCSLTRRRQKYRWRDANLNIYSALVAIEQWGFIRMPHLLWYLISVYMVISEDPWHPHLLPSVWQWSYHYLFLRLTYRSIAAGARTPNLPLNCGANYPWKTKEKMISR